MKETILIIDDESVQATGLAKSLQKEFPNFSFEAYSLEDEIIDAISNRFYSLAIVDIRMDKYQIDGIKVVDKIFETNPFAKVVLVSAFKDEYFRSIKDLLLTGRVIDILDKQPLSKWIPELSSIINKYYSSITSDPSEVNKALMQFYAETKNEKDTYLKGTRFEHFISLLFQSFGYKDIKKRIIDQSSNEVDLMVRNEIDDSFLNKFGKYILVECKNKPEEGVSKNDFIVFNSKLHSTYGLAEFGIIATTGHIKRTVFIEATRDSKSVGKIIFLSNNEIIRLINSSNKLEEFKSIIDDQVKV